MQTYTHRASAAAAAQDTVSSELQRRITIVAPSCRVVDHTGCIIIQLECTRMAVKREVEWHGAVKRQRQRKRERERAETSHAQRQTRNPIAWVGSRKWIVRDRRGEGGGGEGKCLLPFFSCSYFLLSI